uniref:Uncharacterized protein n=1 Tax=Naja naja TaxID=35670 RepID=A0A8C6X1Z9_NAJNA
TSSDYLLKYLNVKPPEAPGAAGSIEWVLPQRRPYPWGSPADTVWPTAPQGGPVCESAWDVGKPLLAAGSPSSIPVLSHAGYRSRISVAKESKDSVVVIYLYAALLPKDSGRRTYKKEYIYNKKILNKYKSINY